LVRERGILPARLAEESGLTLAAVRRILSGAVRPSIESALRFAEVLDVEVEDLFAED
jgi:transcriptional regulator with XRE-family HTH domain